jgi:hypothetical protein
MAMNENKTALANAALPVANYSRFTLVAASGTTINVSFDNGATFVAYSTTTIPAAGFLTISDSMTHVKLNANYRVIGVVSVASL